MGNVNDLGCCLTEKRKSKPPLEASTVKPNQIALIKNTQLTEPQCQICYFPFDGDDRFPIMIGKCGHTFCKLCSQNLHKCPYKCPVRVQLVKNFAFFELLQTSRISASNIEQKTDRFFRKGEIEERKRNFKQAILNYEISLQKTPIQTFERVLKLGKLYSKIGNCKKAINCFSKVFEMAPEDNLYEIYSFRGACYLQLNDKKFAEKDLLKSLELNPNNLEAKYTLAQIYDETDRRVQAVQLRIEINEAEPQLHSDFNTQGLVFLLNNLGQEALECFNQAIRESPDESVYYLNRALCKSLIGDTSAETDYELSVDLNPYNKFAILQAAQFFRNAEEYEEAIKYYTMEIDLNREQSNSFAQRGKCYMKLRQCRKALEDYREALLRDPSKVELKKYMNEMIYYD